MFMDSNQMSFPGDGHGGSCRCPESTFFVLPAGPEHPPLQQPLLKAVSLSTAQDGQIWPGQPTQPEAF